MKMTWFLILALFNLNLLGQSENSNSSDQYLVQYDENDPKLIKIEAQIILEDSLLYMSENGPLPERWPHYINNLLVFDQYSETMDVHFQDSVVWVINHAEPGQQIKLQYEVRLEHEDIEWPGGIDGVAFVRDWGIMTCGRAIFVLNGDQSKKDIVVEFRKPKAWKVSIPWYQVDSSKDIYRVQNLLQLQESLLFAGTHEEVNLMRDGFNLKFVLGGEAIVENKQEYVQRAGDVLDYYIEMMGGIPKPEPGDNLSQILVIINQSDLIDGEVIGNHISLLLNPNADRQGQIIGWFLFAHEFFHLWNGKSLRFQGTEVDWFKEGVTNYYTLKGLYNAGFVGEEGVKMILNNLFYARYINDSGYGKLAPAFAASGFDKDNHWGLIYGGGLFAGICMDMEIRNNAQNAHSLDYLMRYFYEKFAGTERTISNEDILKQVNQLAGSDLTEFMNSFVKGHEVIPLGNYLEYAGIKVDTTDEQLMLIHQDPKDDLQPEIWAGFLGMN